MPTLIAATRTTAGTLLLIFQQLLMGGLFLRVVKSHFHGRYLRAQTVQGTNYA